ncbi:MAG: transporter substrate-binding domain-containing protein [Gammaproteobacteria bacterium]|nr:transporter substrate-binding domain-containing protein [Gammaproteobacteria bacterium]
MNTTIVNRILVLSIGLFALWGCDTGTSTATDSGQADAATAQPQAAATPSPSEAPEDCTLVMGWDPWMPYQYRAANGSVTGLDIEIASAAAASAGCALETREGSWVEHLQALESGELDFVGGASHTPAREEFGRFTEPYRTEEFVLFVVTEDSPISGDSLAAVLEGGATIGTVAGFYYGGAVADLQAAGDYSGQFTEAEISDLNFQALVRGDISAVLEDPYVGAALLRVDGLADQVEEYPVEISTGEVSFMFSRKAVDDATYQRFSEALERMRSSGALESILDRYRD